MGWNDLKEEMTPLRGRTYLDDKGNEYSFCGLVDDLDSDYYYLMYNITLKQDELFSCVGTLESCGFKLACTY